MNHTDFSTKLSEYHQLLSLSLDLVVVFDNESKFETVSDSCLKILGYRPEELIGRAFLEFVHPEDVNKTATETKSISDGHAVSSFENRYIHKNGSTVYLQWSSRFDETTKKYFSLAKDITTTKLNEKAESIENEINKALVNSTSNLIWSLDKELKFTGFNKAFKKSREKDYNATIEIGISTFEAMGFNKKVEAYWKGIYHKVLAGETIKIEYDTSAIESNPANIKWHSIELNPIYNHGEIIGIIGNSADITEMKLAAKALEEKNHLIETVIKEIPMGIAVNEIESGNTIYTNAQFSETYNWPEADLRSVFNFFNKVYPKNNQQAKRIIADLESKDPKRMVWNNVPVRGQDDSVRYVNAKNIPLYDQGIMISTVTDNTDLYLNKLALEATYLEKKDILDSISDAFYTLDEAYNFTFLNKHSLEIMGMSQEDLVGKNLFSIFPELENTLFFEKLKSVSNTKEAAKFEFYYDFFNTWFDERIYKTADGFSVFFVDITIRKQFEIELEKLNQSLKQKNEELEQFAFVASHDLQEPLRVISSFMDLLKIHFGDELDETATKYINYSIDGSKRMKQIIMDLLDYSRAGSTEDNIAKIDCNELMEEIIALLEEPIASKKATITYDKLPTLHYNATALRQVFMNLIGNAIKYVQNGDNPKIHISAQLSNGFYQFKVSDNGIGIEQKHYSQIFTIFKRLHNKSEYSGTGIGLAICKKIIEKYGGEISLQSEMGDGTTFSFTIPQKK